jgi:glycosyltransferase involved in cell wall biosynthesis
VVVPTKNNKDTIGDCLSSLMRTDFSPFLGKVIVVDGHSTDGTVEIAKSFDAFVVQDDGGGFAAALDIGWRLCENELVMFIDSDAMAGKNLFPKAIDFFEQDPRLGILGVESTTVIKDRMSRVLAEANEFYSDITLRTLQRPKALRKLLRMVTLHGRNSVTITGPCYLIRLSALRRIGGIPTGTDDFYISRAVINAGFTGKWWVGGQVLHYPPKSLISLTRQRYHQGTQQSYIIGRYYGKKELLDQFMKLLAAPAMAIPQAIYYSNPWHFFFYPLAALSQLTGFMSRITRPYPGNMNK